MTIPSEKSARNILRVTIFGLIKIEGQGIAAIVGGVFIVVIVVGAALF
jgi:hypothetical protein